MRRPAYTWAAILGGLAGFDLWCAKNAVIGDSLSECTRAAFRTHHPLGRAAWTVFLTTGSYVLWAHIARIVDDNLAELD